MTQIKIFVNTIRTFQQIFEGLKMVTLTKFHPSSDNIYKIKQRESVSLLSEDLIKCAVSQYHQSILRKRCQRPIDSSLKI